MKTLVFILATLGLKLGALGANLHAPSLCAQGQMLHLTNLSGQAQPVWLQTLTDEGFQEIPWVLEKGESRTLTAADLPKEEFSLKTTSEKILAISECGVLKAIWTDEVSPSQKFLLKPGQVYKVFAQNLNPYPQTLMLRTLKTGGASSNFSLETGNYLKTAVTKFRADGNELQIEAQGRVSLVVMEYENSVPHSLVPAASRPALVDADPTAFYFLMTNSDQSAFFSVKIADPLLLAKARQIIKNGEWKLMIGNIAYSPRAENRPLGSATAAPYSWKVDQVTNFNDFADISCDGSPEGVEEQIFARLKSRQICFWNYHLLRELSPDEVRYGELRSNP